MITRISLENFKVFKNIDINVTSLTLLTGKNGMGKSSLIQSLLLLRQSYLIDKTLSELTLNGSLVNIGYGKDLLNISGGDQIGVDVWFDESKSVSLVYHAKLDSDKLMIDTKDHSSNAEELSLFSKHFQYLSAERISPRRTYEASPHAVDVLKTLGERGQYTVHFLDKYKFESIPILTLRHPNAKSNALLDNIDAWLSDISSPIRVKPRYHPDLQISTLSFEFIDDNDTTPEFTALNTGFGITYVLPVIVAVLSAQRGDLLIFENPESHLHPQGQSLLGLLISRAAEEGVQIIVESHSDHLFNGMRVAVKEKILSENNLSVYFFSRDIEEHSAYIEQPLIDKDGRLSFQPEDFFDEYAKLLTQIIKKN